MSFDLRHGDCLEIMAQLSDASVDLILCDLPYGTTACKWDSVIPFEPLWAQYRRVAKKNAAIVLTASQPFTSALIASNLREYRYSWVWDKATISNPMQAKRQPLRQHEDVTVFAAGGAPAYYPQKTDLHIKSKWRQYAQNDDAAIPGNVGATGVVEGKYPKTIIRFPAAKLVGRTVHPTQKPVALMEYLIRTYTEAGQTVLDNCMGSGTTGVACMNLGRQFIGIERDDKYFAIASERIAAAQRSAA
ncbi:DNA-methyltransferase [Noviluteimonas gilva]|uniref:Methyltransferase n=1 Tax=Noviluteimonas gilva TaxID=2682097 RepID=A0A7C9HXU8_9GAMM|nr:site-specific DNA-methyltransferase [Lysobacter gilvus]MUV13574.1 site-specific DNA-methyltransferase [Lysobacter gilvus]